jgi:hypothetical protein
MRARVILDNLVRNDPRNIEYRSELGQVLSSIALTQERLGQDREARETLSLALTQQQSAVARAPKVGLYRRRLDDDLAALAKIADER